MTQYINAKVNISEGQKEKLQHAIKANCSVVSIRLSHEDLKGNDILAVTKSQAKLEALERLYRSTGLIFLQWQKLFLTIIIQSLHFSSLKKKGMEKTCEKRRKKW